MSYTLFLDTSTKDLLLGVSEDDILLYEQVLAHGNTLSELLIPTLIAFLKSHHLSFDQIGKIAVGIGPGSYIGTRIAVSIAKALAFAKEIPLFSFCSLLLHAPMKEGSFALLFPAKNGNFFTFQGEQRGAVIVEHFSKELSPEEVKTLSVETLITYPSASSPSLKGAQLFLKTQKAPLPCDIHYLGT